MKGHLLLLLEHLLGRRTVVDLKETDVDQDLSSKHTVTSRVHYDHDLAQTIDNVLDALTVVAYDPNCDKVLVTAGAVQWYDSIQHLPPAQESPPIQPYAGKDCDPSTVGLFRWALLYITGTVSNSLSLAWVYGEPGGDYPLIPATGIPLAFVRQRPGPVVVLASEDIVNYKSVHPSYCPASIYWLPPVLNKSELSKYQETREGTSCLVLDTGQHMFYRNGVWVAPKTTSYDNTFYTVDLETETNRIDLPWAIEALPELLVMKDGFVMTPQKDYELVSGPSAYLLFSFMLYPNQRISVIRNPFLGAAYSPESDLNTYKVFHIYVDGLAGQDVFSGSSMQPYKTLQAAFDAIPLASKHGYHIHAKNLQVNDAKVSNVFGQTAYGVLNNRAAKWIRIELDSSCIYDSTRMDYAYVVADSGLILFDSSSVLYPIRLCNCVSSFLSTHIIQDSLLDGGSSYWFESTVDSPATLTVSNSCAFLGFSCSFYSVQLATASYVEIRQCSLYNLLGGYGGLVRIRTSTVFDSITAIGLNAEFTACDLRVTGNFVNSYVTSTNCTFPGDSLHRGNPVFNLSFGSVGIISGSDFTGCRRPPISVKYASVVKVVGCRITDTLGDGIEVFGGSSVRTESCIISKSTSNGIRAEGSSYVEIVNTSGIGNTGFGVLCRKSSFVLRTASTLTGAMGDTYEEVTGGTTVASTGADLSPSVLDQKLEAGIGIAIKTKATLSPSDYKLVISLDTAALADPNHELWNLFTLRPKADIYHHNQRINAGETIEVPVHQPGTGFISSVCKKINNPTPRDKRVETITVNNNLFVQMDSVIGTIMDVGGTHLIYRPGLGYPPSSPYFIYSKTGSYASLQAYALSRLDGIVFDYATPTGTFLRAGFSVDGGRTWRRWGGASWDILPGASVLAQLQSADGVGSVQYYPPAAWEALRTLSLQAIEVGFLFSTSSVSETPLLKSYTWKVVEEGFGHEVTKQFDINYYPSMASFTNQGSGLDAPIVFTILALNK